jgi:DNA polymerase-1
LRPDQFVDFQALMGDSTDNIPGVPGVGKKTALKLIQEFGSLDRVYENVETLDSKSVRNKLAKGKEKAYLSRRLVHLDDAVPIDVSMDDLRRGTYDLDKLVELLTDLEFNRLLEKLKNAGSKSKGRGAGGMQRRRPEGARSNDDPVGVDSGGKPPKREAGAPGAEDAGARGASGNAVSGSSHSTDYRVVDSEEALAALVAAIDGCRELAVDVEASGLDSMRAVLAGIVLSTRAGRAWYVPVKSFIEEDPGSLIPPLESPGLPLETVRAALGPVLADASVKKIGQNIKYDTIVLHNSGFALEGIEFDTMLASYCLNPARRSHGLDSLVMELFGHEMTPFKSLFDTRSKKRDIRTVPLKTTTRYACEDADYTLRLKNVFAPMIDVSQVKDLYYDTEMPLSAVLTKMEITGVTLDLDFLRGLSVEIAATLDRLERSIYAAAGEEFNINSTAHLQEILFKKLGLKPSHKTKTGYSTDVEVLKSLASQHAVPELVLDYRTHTKLRNTYIEALPKLVNPRTGRVHTSYNQAVTTTGRLSSSDPNLQNIPIRTAIGRRIREAFVARSEDWVLLDADYSQIELRIMAHLSQDNELLNAFADDDDVHRRTAARIAGVAVDQVTDDMRSRAKAVNFGIMYGMGARGLAQSLGIETGEAKTFIEDYFDGYPGVKRFIDETIMRAKQDGAVGTLLGRVRQLPDILSKNGRARAFSERIAVNTPIQGTAADIIKLAMVKLDRELARRGLRGEMILQVHDELLFDVPLTELDEMKTVVRESMESAIELDVPLKVDMGVGHNWLEAH